MATLYIVLRINRICLKLIVAYDLQASVRRAEARLARHEIPHRRQRADKGSSRMASEARSALWELIRTYDRPDITKTVATLSQRCEALGVTSPSRATVYNFFLRGPGHTYRKRDLPDAVRSTLYNLSEDTMVPGRQVAFQAFNEGNLQAMMFAAGMPWLDLYQAARVSGWRPRSRGLFDAVIRARGI